MSLVENIFAFLSINTGKTVPPLPSFVDPMACNSDTDCFLDREIYSPLLLAPIGFPEYPCCLREKPVLSMFSALTSAVP